MHVLRPSLHQTEETHKNLKGHLVSHTFLCSPTLFTLLAIDLVHRGKEFQFYTEKRLKFNT